MAQVEGNVKVNVNANQAVRELEKLDNKAEELRREIIKLNKQKVLDPKKIKLVEKELKGVNRETKKLRQSAANYQNVLKNLSGASLTNLKKAARQLNFEINSLDRNTVEWKQKASQLGKIKSEISSVRQKMRELNTTTKKSQGLFGRLADGFNKFGAIGLAAVGVIMMAFNNLKQVFQKFSKTLMDFEDSFTDVLTLLSADQIDEFGESLEEGAIDTMTKFGAEIKDVNKALFDTVSAGVDAADAIGVLDAAGTLATAGAANLSVTTDGLTTVINAYGLAAGEAMDVSNAFFSAQKFGKTTVGELAANYGKLAPVLSNLNISYQEGLSMLAEMTKQGISTAESTTYLKAMFKGLIKPTTEAEKVFRKYNVPMGVTEIRAAGLTKTMEALNNMIAQNPEALKNAIPSVEGMTAAIALSGAGLEDFTTILDQVNTDIGDNSSMMDAYSTKSETMSFKIEQQKAKLSALILEFKDKFAPVISTALTYISKFTNFIRNLTIEFFKTGSEQKQWVVILKEIWKLIDALVSAVIKPFINALKEIFFSTNKNNVVLDILIVTLKLLVGIVKEVGIVIGSLVGALAKGVGILLNYKRATDETIASQRRIVDMNKKVTESVIKEQDELTRLLAIARDDAKSKEERLKAIEKLNAISDEYLGSIKLETINTDETIDAIDRYLQALEQKTKAQIAAQYTEDLTAEIMENEIELYKQKQNLIATEAVVMDIPLTYVSTTTSDIEEEYEETQKSIEQTKLAIEELEKEKQGYLDMIEDMGIDITLYDETVFNNVNGVSETDIGGGTPPVPDYTEVKNNEAELAEYIRNLRKDLLQDEEQRQIKELEIWRENEATKIGEWTASEKEKNKALELLDDMHRQKLLKIGDHYSAIRIQKLDELTDLVQQKELELYGTRDDIIQAEIEQIRDSYDKKIVLALQMAEKNEKTRVLFENKAKELELLREEETRQYKLDKEEEFQNQLQQVKNKYGLQTDDEKMQLELDELQNLYNDKLLSEEDYQRAKRAIIRTANETELEAERKKQEEIFAGKQKSLQDTMQGIDAVSSFFAEAKNAELIAAGDSEEKKKEIMQKYALIELGTTVSKIIASTALAIMNALTIPIGGQILAGIYAVTGAAQVATATAQYNKIQGYEKGGVPVVREQDGKHFIATPTSNRGVISKPSILVAENGPEYIVPNEGMENPEIMNFLMMIEASRVAGTLKHFRMPKSAYGYEDGGFTETQTVEPAETTVSDSQIAQELAMLRIDFANFKDEITAWQKALYVDYFSYVEADKEMTALETKATIK